MTSEAGKEKTHRDSREEGKQARKAPKTAKPVKKAEKKAKLARKAAKPPKPVKKAEKKSAAKSVQKQKDKETVAKK